MSTLRKGLGIGVGTLTVTLFIVVAITLVRGGSVLNALSEPTLWVVEVSTAALAPFAVLTRPSRAGAPPTDAPHKRRSPPAWRVAMETSQAISAETTGSTSNHA